MTPPPTARTPAEHAGQSPIPSYGGGNTCARVSRLSRTYSRSERSETLLPDHAHTLRSSVSAKLWKAPQAIATTPAPRPSTLVWPPTIPLVEMELGLAVSAEETSALVGNESARLQPPVRRRRREIGHRQPVSGGKTDHVCTPDQCTLST